MHLIRNMQAIFKRVQKKKHRFSYKDDLIVTVQLSLNNSYLLKCLLTC